MKKYFNLLVLSMSLLLACGQGDNYSHIFNFEIKNVEEPSQTTSIDGEQITFKGDPTWLFSEIIAYDSLLLSYQAGAQEDFFYKIYNLNNNEFVGKFCRQGRASNEFVGVAPFQQLLIENDVLKALVYDYSGQKTVIWNITESLKQKNTVIDSLLSNKGLNRQPYSYIFYLPGNEYIANAPLYYVLNVKNPPPHYERRSTVDGELLHKYDLYTKIITEGEHPNFYLYTEDRIKPDNSKVAMVMRYFPQVNILDVKSGKVTGIRIDNGDMFNPEDLHYVFRSIDVTNDYIYALYRREFAYPYEPEDKSSVLYQLDWAGNLIKKYELDGANIVEISIDRSGKTKNLYGVASGIEDSQVYKFTLE